MLGSYLPVCWCRVFFFSSYTALYECGRPQLLPVPSVWMVDLCLHLCGRAWPPFSVFPVVRDEAPGECVVPRKDFYVVSVLSFHAVQDDTNLSTDEGVPRFSACLFLCS